MLTCRLAPCSKSLWISDHLDSILFRPSPSVALIMMSPTDTTPSVLSVIGNVVPFGVDISPKRKKLDKKTSNHDYPAPVGAYATIHDRYPDLNGRQLQDVGALLCHV